MMKLLTWWIWTTAMVLFETGADSMKPAITCIYVSVSENMDCSNRNLESLRVGKYPLNVTTVKSLQLQNNTISTLEGDVFCRLTKLTHLDMTGNLLETLDYRLFYNLTELIWLILRNNRLVSLTDERLFSKLSKLQILRLDENKLTSILEGVLKPLHNIEKLGLNSNPFVCDIQLLPTICWCEKRNVCSNAICKGPSSHSELPWRTIGNEECENFQTIQITPTPEVQRFQDVPTSATDHVAIVSGICLVLVLMCCLQVSIYYWKRKRASGQSEGDQLSNYESRSSFDGLKFSDSDNGSQLPSNPDAPDILPQAIIVANSSNLYEEVGNAHVTPGISELYYSASAQIKSNFISEAYGGDKASCPAVIAARSVPSEDFVENELYLAEHECLPPCEISIDNTLYATQE